MGDRVGAVQDEDGLHAEEREAFPDLQAGEGEQALGSAEEGVVVAGWGTALGLDADFDSGQGPLLPYKSMDIRPYHVIKNIPVVIQYRPWWTGGRHR
ncbi:hypothetical protein [Streptomyces sp. uw30]|uniref:hypothetical protein n=1 Tax=Streptomyces sp. uw30 TaxID=1828179 RepID=UPI002905CD97|nr:hypothetical protein [Streptomyces sp. uw30]